MNKGMTLLILLVVLAAMGLIMFSHIGGKEDTQPQPSPSVPDAQAPLPQSRPGYPAAPPQPGAGGLRSIEPPLSLSNERPAYSPTRPTLGDGAPAPVRVTPPADGNPARPVAPQIPPRENTGPGAGTPAAPPPVAQEKPVTPPPAAPERPSPPVTSSPEKPAPSSVPSAPATAKPVAEAPKTPPVEERKPTPAPPAKPAEKPDSSSPGLTPWTTPPGKTPAAAAGQPSQSASGVYALRSIAFNFAGQGLQLQIEADAPFACKSFVLTGPDRLVIDFPGTWKGMRKPAAPQNRLVKDVRLGQHPTGPRLVLDLSAPLRSHKIERSGNTVRIMMQ